MGNCTGGQENDPMGKHSKQIDAEIARERIKLENEVKLLLLGAGDSGKSTVLRQLRIIHQNAFSNDKRDENLQFKDVIQNNVITNMKALLVGAERLNIEILPENVELAKRVTSYDKDVDKFSYELGMDIRKLWKDQNIQKAYTRANEFQLQDSARYYFDRIDAISTLDYIPSREDIVRVRIKTTGIVEVALNYKNTNFRIVDVGGQRSERKKWINCFQDVHAVIFCVALSEYDQKLYEEETKNRMSESLTIFDEILHSHWFKETPIILFLNKSDLFEEKIKTTDLSVAFPDYKGGCNCANAVTYIQTKFVELNKDNKDRRIYPHITNATDTGNIDTVFAAVKDNILQASLRMSGFVSGS